MRVLGAQALRCPFQASFSKPRSTRLAVWRHPFIHRPVVSNGLYRFVSTAFNHIQICTAVTASGLYRRQPNPESGSRSPGNDDRLSAGNEEEQHAARLTAKPGRKRLRLDEACQALYPQHSRALLQSWIMQGKVLVDGQPLTKAGASVKSGGKIEVLAKEPTFVCRAGYKLEGALDAFGLDVAGRVALDSGLSTGGFTDCLLQRGAARVYGVDVGYGQVHHKIRSDPRVVVRERTNLRYLESLPELVDLATLDLSFISLQLVMPAVLKLCAPGARILALVKPQFEARRDQVGGGGIIRNVEARQEIVLRVLRNLQQLGLELEACMQSPITGADGNVEFLALLGAPPAQNHRAPTAKLNSISPEPSGTPLQPCGVSAEPTAALAEAGATFAEPKGPSLGSTVTALCKMENAPSAFFEPGSKLIMWRSTDGMFSVEELRNMKDANL